MHPVILKTFGGLSLQYYIRQFLFGLIFPVLILFALSSGSHLQTIGWFVSGVMLVLNTLLYPYSRFVYESIVSYIIGSNLFFVNAFLMLAVKLMTMALCWFLAVLIAPIGLLYLYVYHSRKAAGEQ